jgi:ketosteroid isomerase-like protein
MPIKVYRAADMNEAFAAARNSGSLDELLGLYEEGAKLLFDAGGSALAGKAEIASELRKLIDMPGTMASRNSFCVEHGELALLRADFTVSDGEMVLYRGFTAEIVRRQPDGSWLYVIDHAGASQYGPAPQ